MKKLRKTALFFAFVFIVSVIIMSCKNKEPIINEMQSTSKAKLSADEHMELVKLGLISERQNIEIVQEHIKNLTKKYNQNFPKKQLFEHYIPLIGVNGVLDFLEEKFPLCHSQAHDLGRAIFSKVGEIGPSLRACGTGCTSGCMHGILMEAFHQISDKELPPHKHIDGGFDIHIDAEDIKNGINLICNSTDFTRIYKIGNCAHGVGHAFMFLSDYNASKAVKYCSYFESKPLQFYCASGANMEYVTAKVATVSEIRKSWNYSCEDYSEFPAACYRYKVTLLMNSLKVGGTKPTINILVGECMKLSNLSRLGCFFGMGFAYLRTIYKQPSYLAEVCSFGNEDDQEICIEGAVEKLADYNETVALEACKYLQGRNKDVCINAAKGGMYRLDKPFRLYFN